MRNVIVYCRYNWIKILVIILLIAATIGSILFARYCLTAYNSLEEFSRQQMAAHMALFLPTFIIVHLVSLPIMLGMQYYFLQGGGLGKVSAEVLSAKDTKVKWGEVIGMEGAKKEAAEIVKLLKDRSLLKVIGGKIIKGTLMVGPPGCGKTYLAKAIATECGLPMISAVGSEFVGMYVGQGIARMKSLFKKAREQAAIEGGCIIFIDEIDSFARPRQADMGFGGGRISHNGTINQFLTEIDGLRHKENNIVIIGATNVSEDELDPAIMRAGRFDRKIHVNRPNLKERKDLFQFYLSRVKSESDIDESLLAKRCLYFTPSDIDNMVREAGVIALREQRETISYKDLSEAYDRVVFGMKSNINMTEEDKTWTAYHEAGHAIIAYMLHPTDDVIKATIVPRKGFLGMVYSRSQEERYGDNKEHLLADIKVSVAAFVAERLKFGTTSNGVGGGRGSDFYQAMKLASFMVRSLGMGKSGLLGDFDAMHDQVGGYLISEQTKITLDSDIQDILQTCVNEVEHILKDRLDLLEHFAQALLKKEELEYDDIVKIFDKFGIKPATKIKI